MKEDQNQIKPHDSNKVIQSLWIGPLSTMERLCIRSYQANGHEFHLYTYGDLDGVPAGTIIEDGNEILPEAQIKRFKHVAQFSNFFYYALLMKKGGWFVDMDNVCLKHYDFADDYVFYRDIEESTISFAVVKAPVNSPVACYCYDVVDQLTQAQLDTMCYQTIGPVLTREAVPKFGLERYVPRGYVFDPICWNRTAQLVNPAAKWDLSRSYSLHLFHGAWNNGVESYAHSMSPQTDVKYPDGCLYEQLKRRYL
jgi:hypothetical protein